MRDLNKPIGQIINIDESEQGLLVTMRIDDPSAMCVLTGHDWDKTRSWTRWYCRTCRKVRKRR